MQSNSVRSTNCRLACACVTHFFLVLVFGFGSFPRERPDDVPVNRETKQTKKKKKRSHESTTVLDDDPRPNQSIAIN